MSEPPEYRLFAHRKRGRERKETRPSGPEFGGECHIDGIGHSHVVTKPPCGGDQRSGLRSAQVPSIEPAQHCRGALLGQRPSHDSLMSHDPGDFDVEVLRHPADGIGRKQLCETPTWAVVGEDLDASGRVDDNGCHACSDSARIVSNTAAASKDSSSGSGAVRSSSMSKRNAAGEQSSSGFATTTRSCNSSARRAMQSRVFATSDTPHAPNACGSPHATDSAGTPAKVLHCTLGRDAVEVRRRTSGLCVGRCAAVRGRGRSGGEA